jgi:hypothetical protein
VDVSVGAVTAGVRVPGPRYTDRGYGPTADVSVGWRDVAAVSLRAEALRTAGRTAGGVYAGVRLGGPTALAASAAAAAALVALVAIIDPS